MPLCLCLGRLVSLQHLLEQFLSCSSCRVPAGVAGPFPPRAVWSLLLPLPRESCSLWQSSSWLIAPRPSTTTAAVGACRAKPSSTSCTTRGSWGRTATRTGPRYCSTAPAATGGAQQGWHSPHHTSLSPQNGTCKFQPEKAIAFVKDVINITQVRPRGLRFQTARAGPRGAAGVPKVCWAEQLELQPVCSWGERAAGYTAAVLQRLCAPGFSELLGTPLLSCPLCAPGFSELLGTPLLSCSLCARGFSELLGTPLLSCTRFGRWHQGSAGAKTQALGSCLLPWGAPPGWHRVLVLLLQLSTGFLVLQDSRVIHPPCPGCWACPGPSTGQEMMRMMTLDPLLQYDEDGMVEAVGKHNPVSFAFEVTSDFMHYRKGVYSNPRCEHTPDKVNHAVLAVGYGEEDGTPYWIVKNSWGRLWGMQGYFLIERGKNMCGLAACASYPVPQV
uniref:Cathepsin H n=1 Tax=Geospiza parvula TaxID=87175 RepID=A0A8U8C9X1_GEOPR